MLSLPERPVNFSEAIKSRRLVLKRNVKERALQLQYCLKYRRLQLRQRERFEQGLKEIAVLVGCDEVIRLFLAPLLPVPRDEKRRRRRRRKPLKAETFAYVSRLIRDGQNEMARDGWHEAIEIFTCALEE